MTTPVPTLLDKAAAWDRNYEVDFADFAEFKESPAQTISSASVAATPPGLTVGAVAWSEALVQARLSGGTPGVTYEVTWTAVLSGGGTLSLLVLSRVY